MKSGWLGKGGERKSLRRFWLDNWSLIREGTIKLFSPPELFVVPGGVVIPGLNSVFVFFAGGDTKNI